MSEITVDRETLYPNFPDRRRNSNYFSYVRQWQRQTGSSLPALCMTDWESHFNILLSRINRHCIDVADGGMCAAYDEIKNEINWFNDLGILTFTHNHHRMQVLFHMVLNFLQAVRAAASGERGLCRNGYNIDYIRITQADYRTPRGNSISREEAKFNGRCMLNIDENEFAAIQRMIIDRNWSGLIDCSIRILNEIRYSRAISNPRWRTQQNGSVASNLRIAAPTNGNSTIIATSRTRNETVGDDTPRTNLAREYQDRIDDSAAIGKVEIIGLLQNSNVQSTTLNAIYEMLLTTMIGEPIRDGEEVTMSSSEV